MKKHIIQKIVILFMLIYTSFINIAYSVEDDIIQSQQASLNIGSFISQANKYTEEVFPDLDAGQLLASAIKGDIDNNQIFQKILSLFGHETLDAIKILGMILAIIVISSILKTVSDNLENKNISQMTYYVQYILIVTLMLSNFSDIIESTRNTIQDMIGFMNTLVPLLVTLMISTGSIISANIIQPVILFCISFIGNIISSVIIPLLLVSTVLGIVSNISDKIQIGKLAKTFKTSIVWILGVGLTAFVGILSLEGTLGSSIDGITAKTAKAAVSSLIPVVGKILGDSIDTILGSAVLLKNAVGFVGIIVVISICAMPILKLTVLSITYSIAAALCEPIADSKIVKLLDQFGDTFKMLLAILFVIAALFLIRNSISSKNIK